jgi:hypothetical protein
MRDNFVLVPTFKASYDLVENADSLLSDMVRNASQILSNAGSVITNEIKNKVEIAGRELVYYFSWMSM